MFKVLYIGFKTHDMLYNILSTYDISIDEIDTLNDFSNLYNYNIIITNNIDIDNNHKHKVISYINKSTDKFINLSYGNVIDSNNTIKLSNYIMNINQDIINTINDYVNNITFDEFINKRYCSLISNHDNGNTKTILYNKLSELGKIVCPLNLFNNYSTEEYYKYNKFTFLKEFIFNICVESNINDCVSNKLLDSVLSGNIPIYFGIMDDLDKNIFNMNRIIFCDINNIESINNTFNIIKDLLYNPNKIYNYYKQPVFNKNALNIINNIKINYFNRINDFINNNIIYGNIYKTIDNNIYLKSNDSNIIISLSTTLDRLYQDSFQDIIRNLLNQKLKPKYIIIKVEIDTEAYIIENNDHPTLIIHCYNSIYKNFNIDNLLLLSSKLNILDNDKIIFINDTYIPDNNFTLIYELCYQLYNCHGITVNNNNDMCIFSDNYNEINENLSYSIKFEYIKDINFDNNQLFQCNEITKKLYMGCIHTLLGISNDDSIILSNNNINNNKIYNINIESLILPRKLLYNVNNIYQNYNHNKHIDIKYYNNNTILLTITYFDNIPIEDIITLRIYNYDYNINIKNNNSYKQSYLLSLNINIDYINHNNYNVDIIQCYKNNNIDINKFYSINTILNNIPDMTYKFFNNNDIYNIISYDSNILNLYNKTNSIRMKINLFKLYYLYINGGLYINCKSILYHPLNLENNIFVKDIHDNKLSNSFYYINNINNNIIEKGLIDLSHNIYNTLYNESIYDMSLIKYNLDTLYIKECNNYWKDSIIKFNNNIIIKSSYYNYNNYINEDHLWKYKKIYN